MKKSVAIATSMLVLMLLAGTVMPHPMPPPQAQITVSVNPTLYGLAASQSLTLFATVANDSSNQGVTWSVSGSSCSGNGCGILSQTTLTSTVYTAPTTGGSYVVTATSVANSTAVSSAQIAVTDLGGVFTYRNNLTVAGVNNKENLLTPSNVNATSFGKLFSCAVDEKVYAQPLWVANVAIAGGVHNIVIVATQNDSVYAFDADGSNGTTCIQYWQASLLGSSYGAASGATAIPPVDTGETQDIDTSIGITSTPVIDPSTNTLYVESNTKENNNYFQRLHALNLATGAENTSWPITIAPSVPGTGQGSSNGTLPFNALHENQRPGLALVNGSVYLAFASHGDITPWHGWVIGYNTATRALSGAFTTSPNSNGGGIWMAGSAPAVDSSNNLYIITSNGTYDGITEFGDSFLKLSTSGGLAIAGSTTLGTFTPDNQSNLSSGNVDLGQGGAITLLDSVAGPHPHLLIGGGKEGLLYLLNRDNMGGYSPNNNNGALQTWSLVGGGGNETGVAAAGAFWQNTFYIAGSAGTMQGFAFNTSTGLFSTNPVSQSTNTFAFPGATPEISASGTTNAILWAVDTSGNGTNGAPTGSAVLYAYNAANLSSLWNSTQNTPQGGSNQAANAVKFVIPTVANGKVYLGAVNSLTVYGLLNLYKTAATPTLSPAPGTYSSFQSVSLSDASSGSTIYYTTDGSLPTTSSNVYTTPINVAVTTTITAMASAPGLGNSPPVSGTYTIQGTGIGKITYVQGNSATPQSPQTTVPVKFNAAQGVGDLNVVVVGWNDTTASVGSVVDSSGNPYTLAVGPTKVTGSLSQSIYYAKNIASAGAGANTVTVTFTQAAAYPDIRILEYGGADLNSPVDVTAANTGNSASSSSGAVTTTNAADLLFGANIVTSITSGPGAGFTSRLLTSPDADIAEDETVSATGSYSATAPLSSGTWIMQLVAFRAAGGSGDTTPPTAPTSLTATGSISSVNLAWTASTDNVGVTGYHVYRSTTSGFTPSPSTLITTTAAASYVDSGLAAGTYYYLVTAFDAAANVSSPSNQATGTVTGDTTPPTAPSNLTATGSISSVNLAWTASTDNVGVTGYHVYRSTTSGFTPSPSTLITTTAATSYVDSGLAAGTYYYLVTAFDAAANVSSPSNQATGTVTGDTTPPTAPSNLTATGSISSVNLAWTASTDNVGVTGYHVYRSTTSGFTPSPSTLITTTAATSYVDSGLAAGTYYYLVTAFDAAANVSSPSNQATGTVTGDTTPPTAPSNLTATAVSGSQINLSWTASTDNVGVTGYKVERCQGSGCVNFAQIGTTAGATTYSDTGLSTATSYSYRVRATDAASNLSSYSNTASATTLSAPAVITYVQGNSATPQSPQTTVPVKFNAAQGVGDLNVVVVGWNDTTASVGSVVDSSGNPYTLAVGPTKVTGSLSQSIYYAKNIASAGAGANTVTVTFTQAAAYPDIRILEYGGADLNSPVDVTAANTGNSASSSSGAVTTTNAADLLFGANIVTSITSGPGAGFTSRLLTSPDADIAEDETVSATGSYSATAPLSSGTWIMQLVAFRAAGGSGDTTPPTAPTSLTATGSISSVNLAWTASTDNVGVTGYHVYRSTTSGFTPSPSTLITTTAAASYVDSGLAAGTYYYLVTAFDAAANVSSPSNQATGTVTGDTTPPTAPSNLTATGSISSVNLAWTASTDNVGVTGYHVYRSTTSGFTPSPSTLITTTAATSYVDSGLAAGTYYYLVTAFDAAANVSSPSNQATGTVTGDTTPPTAPSNLTATAVSGSQINLSWTASTDNVGVTGYKVERCQGSGCVNFAQIGTTAGATTYSDTGLSTATSYSYRVRATDAASNLSSYSNVATASTPSVPTPTAPTNFTAVGGGPGPIVANVQSYINTVFLTSHTTAAFDSTGGDVMVICSSSHAGVTLTPSDSFGNTWIPIAGPTNTSVGFDLRTQLWYARNPIVGPNHTVTMTLSAPESLVISIFVVKGSNSSSPIDAISLIGSDNGTQTVNVASPNVTTSSATDLLIGFVKVSAGATFTSGPGFAQQPAASSNFLDAESGPAATPGTYSATFTLNTTQTWQSAVVAVANNPNQSSLSWTASTETGGTISAYLVERCQGASCSNFAQIGTTAGTTFNDTGLTASTNYSYRVRAKDTANTLGPYSSVASLTTPAPVPAAPGNLTATASGTQISLSWVASSETGGTISNYLVERCQGAVCSNFSQISTTAGTTFNDTGVSVSTTYTYRVRASDAAAHLSPYSNLAVATTPADSIPPTAPANLTATGSAGSVNLAWTASTDNVGVTGYHVYRSTTSGFTPSPSTLITTTAATSYVDSGLATGTYFYLVTAFDAAANVSSPSNQATGTAAADTTPPTAPSNLTATAVSGTQLNLSWTASTDNVGVTGYKVERCQGSGCVNFAQIGTTTGATIYSDTALTGSTTYSYRVRATDAAGNLSGYSNTAGATTLAPPKVITFVQGSYATPQSSQTTVAVVFVGQQTLGDLNVAVVGWNDTTAGVISVVDSSGNPYTLAVGPTKVTGSLSQSIYYAKNIASAAAGTNTVTVTFTQAAAYPDIRILEYSGADPSNPVDVKVANTGNSTSSSSGTVTTTNATDLLFGANIVTSITSGPGAGFTSRLLTSPDADIAEDEMVSATGSYSATAPLSSGAWIMQLVAFRTAP